MKQHYVILHARDDDEVLLTKKSKVDGHLIRIT